VDINGKIYQEVTDFKYLGSIITSDNNFERHIKARMAAGNQCSVQNNEVTEISKSTKLKIYRTLIRPIVLYGCEGWTMSKHMEEALRQWRGVRCSFL
jgi:hypothetical protein